MTKTALINALSVVPENADISVNFCTSYDCAYKGEFTGINLTISHDDILTVVVQVTEVSEYEID